MVPGAHIPAMIAAQSSAKRQLLLKHLRALPPGEATRERLLAEDPTMAPVLDRLLAERLVRERGDGTLRVDESAHSARQSSDAKVALLAGCVVLAISAGIIITLLLVR